MSKLFNEFPKITEKEWKNAVQNELKGADYNEILCWNTAEGFQVKPLYTKDDVSHNVGIESKNSWKIVTEFESATNLPYGNLDGVILKSNHLNEFIASENELIILSCEDELPSKKAPSKNSLIDWDFLGDLALLGNFPNKDKVATIAHAKELMKSDFQKVFSIHMNHFQNMGANHVEQLAVSISIANEYANIFGAAALGKLMLRNAAGSNFFFEIAKLRAFKILFGNLCKNYEVESDIFILSESSFRNKSVLDKYNNIIRTTFEAAASIFGNSDAVLVYPYDELFVEKSESAHELSFKQQWVLREESFLNHYVDAFKDSYYVEFLTNKMALSAWELFKAWEKEGGYLSCLHKNIIQNKIQASEKQEQALFDDEKIPLIGVNKFPNKEDKVIKESLKKEIQKPEKVLFKTLTYKRLSEKIENTNATT